MRGVLGSLWCLAVVAFALAFPSGATAVERAYELVTPPGSNGRVLAGSGMATPGGDVVCFDAENALAGSAVNGDLSPDGFCSWRTASGWETKWVTGPDVAEPRGGYGAAVFFVSSDGSRVAFATDRGIYPDWPGSPPGGPPPGEYSPIPTQSAFMWEGGGMPRWLAPSTAPLPDRSPRTPMAASADLRHGIFQSALGLVPQDTNDQADVYEWTPDGIRLVSRDASGAAVGGTVTLTVASGSAIPGTISRDGSRVFFEHAGSLDGSGAPGAPWRSVYMREGDELTLVSPRRGGDTSNHVDFVGASDDGEIVYLESVERLTPEPKQAGSAIYRYDIANDTLSLVATNPAGALLLGASADGSTAVYRTGRFSTAGELQATRDGVVTTLGTVSSLDRFNTIGSSDNHTRALRIAAGGDAVVFSSFGSFAGTPAGTRQVYRWTPETGVERISAPADGAAPTAHADIGNFSLSFGDSPRFVGVVNTLRKWPLAGRVLAEDGRVFFESEERLAAGDVNDFVDVYEWNEGTLALVSPGTQRSDALYHDNSADGETVFFTTSARLIPQLDRNGTSDLYAARMGGGFPLPDPTGECHGEDCQGSGPPGPEGERPATRDYRGPGNVDRARAAVARLSLAPVTAAQRRSLSRRGRAVLRASVSRRGLVKLVARAKVAGRSRVVARSVRVVRANARAGLSLRLSKRARVALREKKGLRLVISVRYSESSEAVRRVVMLRG